MCACRRRTFQPLRLLRCCRRPEVRTNLAMFQMCITLSHGLCYAEIVLLHALRSSGQRRVDKTLELIGTGMRRGVLLFTLGTSVFIFCRIQSVSSDLNYIFLSLMISYPGVMPGSATLPSHEFRRGPGTEAQPVLPDWLATLPSSANNTIQDRDPTEG